MGSLIKSILIMPSLIDHDNDQDKERDAFLNTAHGSQIQIKTYIKNKDYLYMLISHGNAEDIYTVYEWVSKILVNFVNINVVMYEYTGYGLNQEKFSCCEQYCYNDADTAYEYITKKFKCSSGKNYYFW